MIYKHRNFITLHISKILLIRNSGSIIRNSNTINCFHIKRVMFRKRVIIIMTSFINIKINVKIVIIILVLNMIMPIKYHMIVILLSLLPLLLMRVNLLTWRVIKFLCLRVMKRILYMIIILLNSFMMLLKITMREEQMLLHIAIISSFLSMC